MYLDIRPRRELSRLRMNQVTMTDDWDGNHRLYRLSDDVAHELESRMDSFASFTSYGPL